MSKKVRTPGDYTKNIGNGKPEWNMMQSYNSNRLGTLHRIEPAASNKASDVREAQSERKNNSKPKSQETVKKDTRKILEDAFKKNSFKRTSKT
jgi:hypothetical protein